MCNLRTNFKHEYERRFFIVGLTKMLMSPQLPSSLQPMLVSLLSQLVEGITTLHKVLAARHTKMEKNNDSDDDSDSDDDDEDSDDDVEEKGTS